jgi:uncharacterized protein
MGAAENIELVRRGYAAFTTGDLAALGELFSPDIVHSVPGDNAISGDHKGIDAVFALYGDLFTRSEGTLQIALEDVLTNGSNQVLAVHQATASANGKPFQQREALLFTIEDGKVVSIQDFFTDLDEQNTFWS